MFWEVRRVEGIDWKSLFVKKFNAVYFYQCRVSTCPAVFDPHAWLFCTAPLPARCDTASRPRIHPCHTKLAHAPTQPLPLPQPKHPDRIPPRRLNNYLNRHTFDTRNNPSNLANLTRLVPSLDHGPLDPLLLLNRFGLNPIPRPIPQPSRRSMTRPNLTPRPIRLQLKTFQRNSPHDIQILLRLQTTPIHPHIQAQRQQPLHLPPRSRKTMHQPTPRQSPLPQIRRKYRLEILRRGARVQEKRQVEFGSHV